MLSQTEILINDRFVELSNLLKVKHGYRSTAAFARDLGLHPQLFSDYKSHKLKVGIAVLGKVIKKFPETNATYVLTGVGEALAAEYAPNSKVSLFGEDAADYLKEVQPKDFERLKIEYLIYRTRCEAYENAMKLSGNILGNTNIEDPKNIENESE